MGEKSSRAGVLGKAGRELASDCGTYRSQRSERHVRGKQREREREMRLREVTLDKGERQISY